KDDHLSAQGIVTPSGSIVEPDLFRGSSVKGPHRSGVSNRRKELLVLLVLAMFIPVRLIFLELAQGRAQAIDARRLVLTSLERDAQSLVRIGWEAIGSESYKTADSAAFDSKLNSERA